MKSWERMKRDAVLIAVGNIPYVYEKMAPYALLMGIETGRFGWRKQAEELRDAAIRIIEHWDVRRAKALVDLFPGIVPQRCVGKVPVCYMADNEKAEWMVEFPEAWMEGPPTGYGGLSCIA